VTHIRDVLIKIWLYVPPFNPSWIRFAPAFIPKDDALLLDLGWPLFAEGSDGVLVFGDYFFGGGVELDGGVVDGDVFYLDSVVGGVEVFEVAGSVGPQLAIVAAS